jgi:hypothetical protein
MSIAGGAFGGVIGAVIVRGIFPVRHRDILDFLIMLNGGLTAYGAVREGLTDDTARSITNFAATTVATSYMVGGTPLTRRLMIA